MARNISYKLFSIGMVLIMYLSSCASNGPSKEEYQALQERLNQLEQQQQRQQSAPAQTNIQGAWEIRTDKGVYVISFVDDTFTVYTRDGGYVLNGIYYIGVKSPWGIRSNTRNPQHTGNLFLMFDIGWGLDELGFTCEISSNRLILSSDGFNNPSSVPLQISGTNAYSLLSGTYGRSSFTESNAGNPLAGFWKAEFTNATQIIRFFNGPGTLYTFIPAEQKFYVGPFTYTYESGAGRFTFINNGESFSFTVNGNVLLLDGNEFRKR
jgi:hypothetical protein